MQRNILNYLAVKEMQSKECTDFISNPINRDLKNSYVRLEVIADRDGFGLNLTVTSRKN